MPRKKKTVTTAAEPDAGRRTASSVDEMLLAALARGDDSLQTGRYLATFKEGAGDAAAKSFAAQGMRVADARDFKSQAASLENVADADAMVFPEIGVALIGGPAAPQRGMAASAEGAGGDSAPAPIRPEYF